MNRATVNKIFQKHPVYVKAGMIAVISIIIFGCVYSKDNGKKLEKDEKGREILRRNESGKDELKNMKVKKIFRNIQTQTKRTDLLITRLNILFRENLLIKKIWKVSLQKYFS